MEIKQAVEKKFSRPNNCKIIETALKWRGNITSSGQRSTLARGKVRMGRIVGPCAVEGRWGYGTKLGLPHPDPAPPTLHSFLNVKRSLGRDIGCQFGLGSGVGAQGIPGAG